MCGRFTLRVPLSVLATQFQFDLETATQLSPRYNVAPTQEIPTVRLQDGNRQLAMCRWGLIPSWAKDAKIGNSAINARSDTVATKPMFRTAYKKRRCLVLADGYYEWLKVGKEKKPYSYEIDGGEPFAFAGLWEQWWGADQGSEGPPLESCTILTTEANELAAKLHDRMPVILDAVDYDAWLDPATKDVAYLLGQLPADRMSAKPLASTYVNNVRNQGPECIAAIAE